MEIRGFSNQTLIITKEIGSFTLKVFFDEDKPQTFTDKLKIISKYFILKLGKSGFSFSRKTSKSFHKDALVPILEEKIKNHHGIFVFVDLE